MQMNWLIIEIFTDLQIKVPGSHYKELVQSNAQIDFGIYNELRLTFIVYCFLQSSKVTDHSLYLMKIYLYLEIPLSGYD